MQQLEFNNTNTKLTRISLISYIESMPYSIEECIEHLKDYITSYAYIYHDRDYNDLGELKKPHYHVLMTFNKKVNVATILNVFGVKVYQKLKNMFGAVQYLIHKGYIDKTQYSVDEIRAYNIDVVGICEQVNSTGQFELEGLQAILLFIKNNECDYVDVVDFALKNHLYAVLKANGLIICEYLKAMNKSNRKREICYEENEYF